MKKLLLLLTLALCAPIAFAQNVPSYVSTDGLVGYWGFNGNADDQSGNGNNGTVNGATLTSDRIGNIDNAYYFSGDGCATRIDVAINVNKITTGLTLSYWALQSGDGCIAPRIMEFYTDGDGPGTLGTQNWNNYWQLSHVFSNNTSINLSGNPTPLNKWFQLTYTNDGTIAKLYQNGYLVDSASVTGNPILSSNFAIGRMNHPAYDAHEGNIDDIGIWNRALTQEEITNMYNGVNYSDTCNAVSGSLTQGLVGYWPFCGNANDDSGNGNNGTVNGATLTSDRFGNTNSAYNFNGISNYIDLTSAAYRITGNADRSIVAWVKTTSQGYKAIFSTGSGVSGNPCSNNGKTFNVKIANSRLSLMSYNCGTCSTCDFYPNTGFNVIDNLWHNVVVILKSNVIYTYVDGNLDNSINMPNINTTGDFNFIGKDNHIGIEDYFEGLIDDIGIWNRALTPSEVTQLYNQNQCFTNITVTDTLIINVGQLSYTNPIFYANNITLYPNPANTQVNISFTNITDLTGGQIKIINSLGQQVVTTPITLSGTNTTIPLTTWGGAGLYFVQILNAQGIVVDVKKIILQ